MLMLAVLQVDLGGGRVGLLSNLHTMAYQGNQPLLELAMAEVQQAATQFRRREV